MKQLDHTILEKVTRYLDTIQSELFCLNRAYIFCNNSDESPVYYEEKEKSLLFYKYRKKTLYLMVPPVSRDKDSIITLIQYAFEEHNIKYCESFPLSYMEYLPDQYRIGYITKERIIPTIETIELRTGKLRKRRQDMNYCTRTYQPVIRDYREEDFTGCEELTRKWAAEFKKRNPRIPLLYRDLEKNIFLHKDLLSIRVLIAEIEGNIEGYITGIKVKEDLFCPLTIKYNHTMRGLSALLFSEIGKRFSGCKYSNQGSDAANENLDFAKKRFTIIREHEIGVLYRSPRAI